MSTPIIDLPRFFHKVRTTKRYWLPLTIMVIVAVNLFGLTLPPRYASTATVLIIKPQIDWGIQQQMWGIRDRLDTIREQITSSPFLGEVARHQNLDLGLEPDSPSHRMLINEMRGHVVIGVRNEDLFTIQYNGGRTPKEAKDVTQEIVDLFIERTSSFFNRRTTKNRELAESNLNIWKNRLKEAQDNLNEYRLKHSKTIPEAAPELHTHIQMLKQQRNDLTAQLNGKEIQLTMARNSLSGMEPTKIVSQTTMNNPTLDLLRNQKAQMELELDQLRLDLTDAHPQIQRLLQKIGLLDERIQEEQATLVEKTETQENQEYINTRERITALELEIADLREQLAQNTVSQNEAESFQREIMLRTQDIQQLGRVVREAEHQVEFFSAQVSEAELARDVDVRGGGFSFDLNDPPQEPTAPASPNRKKIAAASVLLGGVVGFALVLMFTLADTTIRTDSEARAMLEMPILGVVQHVDSVRDHQASQRRTRATIAYGATMTLLIVGLAVMMIFYQDQVEGGVQAIRQLIGNR